MNKRRVKWLKEFASKHGMGNRFRVVKKIYKRVGHERFLQFVKEIESEKAKI